MTLGSRLVGPCALFLVAGATIWPAAAGAAREAARVLSSPARMIDDQHGAGRAGPRTAAPIEAGERPLTTGREP